MQNFISRAATLAALLTVAALATVPAAHAQTFYSDLASFQAAATIVITYDFEGIAPAGSFADNPAVLTVAAPGRVTFSVTGGIDPAVTAYDSGFGGGIYTLSDGSDSVGAGFPLISTSVTRIDLGDSYTAFAIEYGIERNDPNSFSFALFSGDTQVGTAFDAGFGGGDRFFGATSDTTFDNVRVTAPQGPFGFVVFDNARVGSVGVVVVPEAGTFTLLGVGGSVLCVAVVRRRRFVTEK